MTDTEAKALADAINASFNERLGKLGVQYFPIPPINVHNNVPVPSVEPAQVHLTNEVNVPPISVPATNVPPPDMRPIAEAIERIGQRTMVLVETLATMVQNHEQQIQALAGVLATLAKAVENKPPAPIVNVPERKPFAMRIISMADGSRKIIPEE